MNLNTCNFIKRIEQVLAEVDISAIEDYVIIIVIIEKFVNFCLNNNCVIDNTIFQHKEIHKLTWKSPDGRTVNQIDHVVINNKWSRSLKDVHTCRGADAGSDHYLVVSRLNLCLRKAPIRYVRQRRYNIARLEHEDTQKAFVLEVKNQFQKY